jgi:bacillopeptidase F (M6 metalloprotease family)
MCDLAVSYDTSRHKRVKQLPISVRYFQAYDLETPAKNKVLTFVESSGEIPDMSILAINAIVNHDLERKVVEISADNTNTDFRGLLRRGKKETR